MEIELAWQVYKAKIDKVDFKDITRRFPNAQLVNEHYGGHLILRFQEVTLHIWRSGKVKIDGARSVTQVKQLLDCIV